MRHHRGVARLVRHVDGRERLGERADLVRLDEDGVGDTPLDGLLQDPRVGHEHIVADHLDLLPEEARQLRPAVPVRLAHAVLDGDDREAIGEVRQIAGEGGGGEAALLGLEPVVAVLEELRARHVEPEIHVLPRPVTGLLDRLDEGRERRLVRGKIRRKAALIAHGRGQAACGEQLLQGVEDLGPVAQRFAEARCAHREDHELLDVERIVGVRAAVDDVHLRHRHDRLACAAREARQMAVERHARVPGRRVGGGERYAQDRVGTEPALVLGAVELDHPAVEPRLVARVAADERSLEHRVHVLHGLQHTLASVAFLVPVAQLHRLARAGRGSRRHRRAPERARVENHVGLDRGVAARVEDLAAADIGDATHGSPPLKRPDCFKSSDSS